MENFNPSYVGIRNDLLKFINGKNLTVLDVGCATGVTSGVLKKNRRTSFVIGIENDSEMARIAKENIDEVVVSDLDSFDSSAIKMYQFDYIIFGDILEHLMDPWRVLLEISKLLKEDGRVIISIPNIQHIETFIQIYYHSYWPCNSRGIFDKTHVRFFTYKNIIKLVDYAGLYIHKMERKFRFRDDNRPFPRFTESVLKKIFPNIFTFQYIVSCGKK